MQNIFSQLRREYFPAIICGKLHVRRQTRVGLWECLFSLLRQREKYFPSVIPLRVQYVRVYPATWRRGSVTKQGNKGLSFRGCQHVCRREKTQSYRWLLSRNLASLEFRFRGPFPLTAAVCQLLYAQFVDVDRDFTRCNCYFYGTGFNAELDIGRRERVSAKKNIITAYNNEKIAAVNV